MLHILHVALTLFLLTTNGIDDDTDKARCAAVKEKIRHVQSRMRSGYTRAQGERLEAQLRKLRKQRKTLCR